MIFIIICLFISFYFVAQRWRDNGNETSDCIFATIFIPLMAISAGLILWFSIGYIIGSFMPTVDIKETKELYALQDNNEISGSFFLGSGRIDEEMYYVYIVKEDKGKQIQTLEIDANEIYLNDSTDTPTLDIYSKDFKYEWMYWFAMPKIGYEYVFNIPSGSIDYEHNIDLK